MKIALEMGQRPTTRPYLGQIPSNQGMKSISFGVVVSREKRVLDKCRVVNVYVRLVPGRCNSKSRTT